MSHSHSCGCMCHRSTGLGLSLIGLSFLLGHFNVITADVVSIIWPVVLIVIGSKKLFPNMCKCCKPADGEKGGCC
jgi:hypothetical protein